jgi:hypothetical protein
MVLGVSTRRSARSLEPLPPTAGVPGISKSAVSERLCTGTERKLAELMSREAQEIERQEETSQGELPFGEMAALPAPPAAPEYLTVKDGTLSDRQLSPRSCQLS